MCSWVACVGAMGGAALCTHSPTFDQAQRLLPGINCELKVSMMGDELSAAALYAVQKWVW